MKYHKGYNLLVIGALSLFHTCIVSAAYNEGPEGEVPETTSVGDNGEGACNNGNEPGAIPATYCNNNKGPEGKQTGEIPPTYCNNNKSYEDKVPGTTSYDNKEGYKDEGTTSNEYTYDIKRNPFIYEKYTKMLIAAFIVLLIKEVLWERKFGIIIPNKSGFGGKSPFICVKSVGVPMIVLALYMFLAAK